MTARSIVRTATGILARDRCVLTLRASPQTTQAGKPPADELCKATGASYAWRMKPSSRQSVVRVVVSGVAALALVAACTRAWHLLAQAPEPAKGVRFVPLSQADMKEWLTYLASDELQGRQIFTEGYGLAAFYIAGHLKEWGVKPIGDDGTYFQTVRINGYRTTRNSTVTVTVKGESRTFKHGEHVTFQPNSGGKQTLTFNRVEFVGYGNAADYQGRDVKNQLAVWLPNRDPAVAATAGGRGRGGTGNAAALSTRGARAVLGFAPAPTPPSPTEDTLARAQSALEQAQQAVNEARQQVQGRGGRGAAGAAAGRGAATGPGAPAARGDGPDFTSAQRVDNPVPPQITADETFYEFLFSAAPTTFAQLNTRAEKGEPLAPMTIPDVTVTISIDNTFETVTSQMSKNVVGLVAGTDPKLRDTYVLFGAHLDHIGYRPAGGARPGSGGCRRTQESVAAANQAGRGAAAGPGGGNAPAVAAPPLPALVQQDVISNGADDDGSGSAAMMAIAKAFATGPKPRRSVVFVWHTGEESGLYGSRYNADFPVVPADNVQAQLNMDMIGRDDCDNANGDYTNSVFVVGADRISTDLHNLIVDANAARPRPLTLDYELNDPSDPENIYTRSDHYSYALKGIPVAFFTTGLHRDYHQVSDSVDKIVFPKLQRIAQLVYETGFGIANSDRALERDNKGSRTGRGYEGRLTK